MRGLSERWRSDGEAIMSTWSMSIRHCHWRDIPLVPCPINSPFSLSFYEYFFIHFLGPQCWEHTFTIKKWAESLAFFMEIHSHRFTIRILPSFLIIKKFKCINLLNNWTLIKVLVAVWSGPPIGIIDYPRSNPTNFKNFFRKNQVSNYVLLVVFNWIKNYFNQNFFLHTFTI